MKWHELTKVAPPERPECFPDGHTIVCGAAMSKKAVGYTLHVGWSLDERPGVLHSKWAAKLPDGQTVDLTAECVGPGPHELTGTIGHKTARRLSDGFELVLLGTQPVEAHGFADLDAIVHGGGAP